MSEVFEEQSAIGEEEEEREETYKKLMKTKVDQSVRDEESCQYDAVTQYQT